MSSVAADPAPRGAGLDPAVRFTLVVFAWLIGLFGLMRTAWVEQGLLVPFARLQQRVTGLLLNAPSRGVVVDASCSGADAMALCLGVMLAFPATWRERVRGVSCGFLLIAVLNGLRIATLSAVATDPRLFDLLHLYVWRGVFIVVVAAYVFYWMQTIGRPDGGTPPAAAASRAALGRFAVLAALFAALFFAFSPWLLRSVVLQATTQRVALAGAAILTQFGVGASVAGNVLSTARGAFVVTPECVATPLIPVYLAAVFSTSMTAARRLVALLAAPLLFVALGTARLLVLALPAALIPSYDSAIHAFSQLLVALLLIVVAALWVNGGSVRRRARLTAGAVGVFAAVGIVVGPLWTRAITGATELIQGWLLHAGHHYADAQGALAMLPAFQLALGAALYVALRGLDTRSRPAAAAAALATLQVSLLILVAESSVHLGLEPHVSVLRAGAILVPVLLVWPLERGLQAPAERPRVEGALEQPG